MMEETSNNSRPRPSVSTTMTKEVKEPRIMVAATIRITTITTIPTTIITEEVTAIKDSAEAEEVTAEETAVAEEEIEEAEEEIEAAEEVVADMETLDVAATIKVHLLRKLLFGKISLKKLKL